MYWYVSNLKTKTCVIPYYAIGEQQDFNAQLVVEAGETLRSAYLSLIDSYFVGSVQCRIEPSETWLDVGGVFDSTCFLGTLIGPREISVEFRIEFAAGSPDGEFVIPIQLFHGECLPGGPDYTFSGADDDEFPLWGEEESDAPLWNGSEGEAPFWEDGSMCGRKEYLYLPPGETLAKWDVVRVETDGSEAAYQAAGCVDTESEVDPSELVVEKVWMRAQANGTLGQANVLGIIDDDCVNYVHALDGVVVSDGVQSVYWQGGSVDGTVTDRLWQLNRVTRLWTELAEGEIAGRKHHAGVWYGGSLYIWGGQDSSGTFLNTIYKFAPATATWTALTAGGTARCMAGVLLVGDKIHFVGGVDSSGNVLRTVDIYDISEAAWSTGTSAPTSFASLDLDLSPLKRPTWQVCNGVLFYGGSTAGRDEVFWQYSGTAWTVPAPLADRATPGRGIVPNVPLQPTYSLPQHCVRLQPYGTDGIAEWIGIPVADGVLADLWNEDLGTWMAPLNIGERRALTQGFCTDASWALTIGQQAWLGASAGSRVTTRPDAGWMVVLGEAVSATTFCFAPQSPRYEIIAWANSSWAYDGVRYSYEFGGNDGTGITNRLHRLDWLTMTWEELTPGCTARTNAGMGLSAGILYVIGGKDSDGNMLNTSCTYNTFTETWVELGEGPYAPGYDQVVLSGPWANDGYWAGEWALNYCYYDNAVVYHDGTYYQATQTHLGAAANEPGVGDDWEDYWEIITDLPDVYVVGGVTAPETGTGEVANGDVWVYDPEEEEWNEGIGAGSDFTDTFNTTESDFTEATEASLAANTLESNQWLCDGGGIQLVGWGNYIVALGVRYWLVGGEIPHYQRTMTLYDLSTNEWLESVDLAGDHTYSEVSLDALLPDLGHAITVGAYIYLFGQGDHYIWGECYMAWRINPMTGEFVLVGRTRGDTMEIGVNDRAGASASYYDNKMYIYGGNGTFADVIDIFYFDGTTFVPGAGDSDVGINRHGHKATIQDGILYLFYGADDEGNQIPTANTINLSTMEYAELTVPEEYQYVVGEPLWCADDDGNLFTSGSFAYFPEDNSWSTNEALFLLGTPISNLAYYAGALYYAICDGSNPQLVKIDLGASYVPVAITRTIVRNSDGTFTVTYSTGETSTQYMLTSSSARKVEPVWTSPYDFGSGMKNLWGGGGAGSKKTETITILTGWSTDTGGQKQIQMEYTMTKTTLGLQCTGVTIRYS